MRDLDSIRHQHRTNHEAKLEGYEPILEVEIPGQPAIKEVGNDFLVDFDPELGANARIEPVRDSEYRDEVEQQLRDDPTLQDQLIYSYRQNNIRVPSVDVATRSVINPSTTLLTDHPLVQMLPDKYQREGALLLEYVLKYHEIGTREQPGGHFTSIIDPETLVIGEQLPWSDMHNIIRGRGTHTRALPSRYHEVRAVLQERQILDSLIDEEQSILDAIRSETDKQSVALEEGLKSVDLDRLGKLLADWESYLDTNRYNPITTIADELEAETTREQAIDLLRVPQEAVMNPTKWLCHLLYDLKAGRDPDEIRWHGSYWDTTLHGPDTTFDELKEDTNRRREAMIDDADRRASQSTYELVTISDDSLIRRWYSYKPTDEFRLQHIRSGIVIQQLVSQLRRNGVRVINNGITPAAYIHENGEQPFNAAQYQLQKIDPFEAVLNNEAGVSDIGHYFKYENDKKASYRAWEYGRQLINKKLGFNSSSELVKWIESGET